MNLIKIVRDLTLLGVKCNGLELCYKSVKLLHTMEFDLHNKF